MPACIFHHPFPVIKNGKSGSAIRPFSMRKAFEDLGYTVFDVTGYAEVRKLKMKEVFKFLNTGGSIDFIYSESHTMPTLLTEPHHFPLYPQLDFGFFKKLKRHSVPIGLFYRDIHWRFDLYKKVALVKRMFTIPMYYYDWGQYNNLVDHLFLPSLEMAKHLPSSWPKEKLSHLFPAGELLDLAPKTLDKLLKALYVGGVVPPIYDLKPLFNFTVDKKLDVTVCCRKAEWESVKEDYSVTSNHTIKHLSGEALKTLFEHADVFLILWTPNKYLDFAMPVKLFEAISYALPIIISSGSEAARFVEQEGAGWVVNSEQEFTDLISQLKAQPSILEEKRNHVQTIQAKHSWQARARQVAETLTVL